MVELPPVPLHDLPRAVRQAWDVVASMPFENLTKILKFEQVGRVPELALRTPQEVLEDHRRYGTGATCFALVFLFHDLLKRAGVAASLHTCDRRYGQDTHAAVTVQTARDTWLFDPGFHIVQPLPHEHEAAYVVPGNPNASRIVRTAETRYECYTGHSGKWTLRFVLKSEPLSPDEFRRHWAASFNAEMMAYPVLTRFTQGRMIYLQKSMIVVRDGNSGQPRQISVEELPDIIPRFYGIRPEIVRRALSVCRR